MRKVPKHIVLRDLKRGVVTVQTKSSDSNQNFTLSNRLIPEKHQAEFNPNHPLEKDIVNGWDLDALQWKSFKLSELEEYTPPMLGIEKEYPDE